MYIRASLFKINDLEFLEQCSDHSKVEQEGTETSHIPLAYRLINIPHQSGACTAAGELDTSSPPRSVVYIKVHSWCCTFFVSFANISSQSVACLVLTVSFTEQKFLILLKSILSMILLWIMPLVLYLKSNCQTQGRAGFLLCYLPGVL